MMKLCVYKSSKLLETVAEYFHNEIVQIRKVMVRSTINLKSTVGNHPAQDPTIKDQFRNNQDRTDYISPRLGPTVKD